MNFLLWTVLIFYLDLIHGKIDKCSRLSWAPTRSPRKPYITFLNDAGCPSWRTRYSITNELSTSTSTSLTLPRGTPFAAACGSCFQSSFLEANLTMKTTGVEGKLFPQPRSGELYDINDYVQCLISYLLTEPLQHPGTISCKLNRGYRPSEETITYKLRDVNLVEFPEQEIRLKSGTVLLQCPAPLLENKRNIVYVWHPYLEENSSNFSILDKLDTIVTNLRQNVTYVPSKTVSKISCSTYDIYNPLTVWRQTYTIHDERKDKIVPGEWSITGEIKNPDEKNNVFDNSINFASPVAWLIGIGVVITIIGVALSLSHFSFKNNKSDSGKLTDSILNSGNKSDFLLRTENQR